MPRSIADPLKSNEANVTGTLLLLEAVREAGIKRVVFAAAASSSAYGDTEALPKAEDMPVNPLSPYAVNKYTEARPGDVKHSLAAIERAKELLG